MRKKCVMHKTNLKYNYETIWKILSNKQFETVKRDQFQLHVIWNVELKNLYTIDI